MKSHFKNITCTFEKLSETDVRREGVSVLKRVGEVQATLPRQQTAGVTNKGHMERRK